MRVCIDHLHRYPYHHLGSGSRTRGDLEPTPQRADALPDSLQAQPASGNGRDHRGRIEATAIVADAADDLAVLEPVRALGAPPPRVPVPVRGPSLGRR